MKQSMTSKNGNAVSAASNDTLSRLLTAAVGIFIILALLHFGNSTFWIATVAIFAGCTYELIGLLRIKGFKCSLLLSHLLLFFGPLYLALVFSLNALIALPNGRFLALYVLFATWFFDTAAYYVGSHWGRHKIIPKISPNKSLEGFLAGLAAVSLVSIFLPGYLTPALKLFWLFSISICAFLGDVIESSYKRWVGVKDSSDILPGHGGFLDRFDSLILTSFVSYMLFRWFL